MASSIYSFDDTHQQTVVRPSGPVAFAALALAKLKPASRARCFRQRSRLADLQCRLGKPLKVLPAKGSIAGPGIGITAGIEAAAGDLRGLVCSECGRRASA